MDYKIKQKIDMIISHPDCITMNNNMINWNNSTYKNILNLNNFTNKNMMNISIIQHICNNQYDNYYYYFIYNNIVIFIQENK